MTDFATFSENELMELLAATTTKYTHLLNMDTGGDEKKDCKKIVDAIVDEICRRKSESGK